MTWIIVITSICYIGLQIGDMVTTLLFTDELGLETESNKMMRDILSKEKPIIRYTLFLLYWLIIIFLPMAMYWIYSDYYIYFTIAFWAKILYPKKGLLSAVATNVKAIINGG